MKTRMRPRTVGLIGFGSIGQSIVDAWQRDPVPGHRLTAILVRPRQAERAELMAPEETAVTTDLQEFLDKRLDIVIEAAGHSAVTECAPLVLRHGASMMILSVGALADDTFRESLLALAASNTSRIAIPVGAIAGIDGLLALRRAGLESVSYQSTKPPLSWKGTVAEQAFDLDNLSAPAVIFDGNAADAARLYPRNANLAATIALAGLGLERTKVRLVADPRMTGNSGHLIAEGRTSRLSVVVEGNQTADNPKSSLITGLSVLSSLCNEESMLSFR